MDGRREGDRDAADCAGEDKKAFASLLMTVKENHPKLLAVSGVPGEGAGWSHQKYDRPDRLALNHEVTSLWSRRSN